MLSPVLRALGASGLTCAAALAAGAPAAQAQTLTPAMLAASCDNCHGPGGASPGAIPAIDKLDAATIATRLKGYRRGEIEATVMTRIARGFSEAEIDSLALYLAAGRR